MTSFHDAIEALAPDGAAYVIDAPQDWAQGRTLYGGMTAALAHEAVRRGLGDLGPLRSAQFTFIGPASGQLRFETSLLRRGRSSALVACDCLNAEGTAARSLFVFGGARESKVAHDYLPLPELPRPEALTPFRKEGASAPRGFWNNFETRLAKGGRLFDISEPRPEFSVWTRFLDVGPAHPLTALLAMADCLPPAAMVHFPAPAPISTMTWTVDVLTQPQSLDDWVLLHASSEHAGDGYSMQSMMMWGADGAPLAVGRQTVAIFA
jgi:acyl-CoA thioesterase